MSTASSLGNHVDLIERVGMQELPRIAAVFRGGADDIVVGFLAAREHPAVWVWKRISIDSRAVAPKRSFMIRAQMRRLARILAISSKKSICEFQKKEKLPCELMDLEVLF